MLVWCWAHFTQLRHWSILFLFVDNNRFSSSNLMPVLHFRATNWPCVVTRLSVSLVHIQLQFVTSNSFTRQSVLGLHTRVKDEFLFPSSWLAPRSEVWNLPQKKCFTRILIIFDLPVYSTWTVPGSLQRSPAKRCFGEMALPILQFDSVVPCLEDYNNILMSALFTFNSSPSQATDFDVSWFPDCVPEWSMSFFSRKSDLHHAHYPSVITELIDNDHRRW